MLLKIDYCSISKERTVERAEKSGSMGLYEQIKMLRSKNLSSKYCFFSFTPRVTMQGGGSESAELQGYVCISCKQLK